MDIRLALVILRRRWWLVVGLPLLVGGLSWATAAPPETVYQSRLSFAVDIPRSARVPGGDDDTAIAESLIDDIARVIPGDVFAEAVTARLPAGMRVTAGELASDLSAEDRHRVADVTVTRAAPPGATPSQVAAVRAELATIASAVVAELEQHGRQWFARLGEDDIAITIVDRPDVTVVPPSLRVRLDFPLRLGLATLVAVGLAFALHALDPHLYTADEAAAVAEATVLGEIPRRGRRARRG